VTLSTGLPENKFAGVWIMFNSKFFTVVVVLTFLALGAAVTFQALEMQEYNLWNTLQARFFPAK
jgi:hypothetical protein